MQTLILSVDQVNAWRKPPFQRPLRANRKTEKLTEEIKHEQSLPGVITLGKLAGEEDIYTVDGQHRAHCFLASGLPEVIADIRLVTFDTMADMADEFELLNDALVRMRPDDVLRAAEMSSPAMQRIRRECDFVGYDNLRYGGSASSMVGMSVLLKVWMASAMETPANYSSRTAALIADELDGDEQSVAQLCRFLQHAVEAWGRDPEYYRLWGALNLALCMWLYRHLVIEKQSGVKRHIQLTEAQFRQCLMSLSADAKYCDWLVGRQLRERDRAPCYAHLRRIFVKRLEDSGVSKVLMPQPAWASSAGRGPSGKR